jgi:hypothetical protein
MKRKLKSGHTSLKSKLGLPDLEHAKVAVIVSLRSFESQRSYRHSIDEFVAWYCSAPRLSFNKAVVLRCRLYLEDRTWLQALSTSGWQLCEGWHMKQ